MVDFGTECVKRRSSDSGLTDGILNMPYVLTFLFPVSAVGSCLCAHCKIKAFRKQHSSYTGISRTLRQQNSLVKEYISCDGAWHLHSEKYMDVIPKLHFECDLFTVFTLVCVIG
jgi:uncharacterized membrane protein YcgQ (UPF0703/DUF1980 family)